MTDDTTWSAVFMPGNDESYFQDLDMPQSFNLDQQFHPAEVWFFSECARLAYHVNETSRQRALQQIGWKEHAWSAVEDLAAGIWTRGDCCVLVFRGTNQAKNWQRNVDAAATAWHGGLVHSGFLEAFQDCWEVLEKQLPEYQQLICTGHSLGAALASIASVHCNADALFSFGSPRLGDRAFADAFQVPHHIRCCNVDDIVTHLPPNKKPFQYQHIGEPCWLGDKSRKRDRFKQRLADPKQWFATPKHIRDHAPINYSKRIAALQH